MNNYLCVRSLVLCLLTAVARTSLVVPASMLSPFNVPQVMGPESLNAVKLAVGTRLLNAAGSLGIGSAGTLASSLLGGAGAPSGSFFQPGLGSLFGGGNLLTPRNKNNFAKRRGPNIPTSFNIREATQTEIENFFGVLHRVDANKCISRLVCEIGANPKVLEGMGHNVKEVFGSLRTLEKNSLSTRYKNIMTEGQKKGFSSCTRSFPTCDAKSYRMVRTFVRAFKVKN